MRIVDNQGRAVVLERSFLETGMFGDGSDAAVTFGGGTVLGLTPTGSGTGPDPYVYTMNRSIFCSSITINTNVVIKTAGYRIFCAGTLTNGGTITNAGPAGTNNTGISGASGGSGGGDGTLSGGG